MDVDGDTAQRNDIKGKSDDDKTTVTIDIGCGGMLYTCDNINNYQMHSEELSPLLYFFFVLNMYEEKMTAAVDTRHVRGDTSVNVTVENDHEGRVCGQFTGRPQNEHVKYQEGHPCCESAQQVLRSRHHNMLPSIVRSYFPRSDDQDIYSFYCVGMLGLFKLWRKLQNLKQPKEMWEEAFQVFMHTASQQMYEILDGIQYYYYCLDAVQQACQA